VPCWNAFSHSFGHNHSIALLCLSLIRKNFLPLSPPLIGDEEIDAVVDTLRSGWLTTGPKTGRFEREFAEYVAAPVALASPGSIYNYTNGEQLICGDDPERYYVDRLLPIKLALDLVYIRRASLAYDLRIMARTTWVILASCLGKSTFSEPWEMSEANLIEQNIGEADQRSDQPEPLHTEPTDS